MALNRTKLLSVHEFARLAKRPPSQIYTLIARGNKYGKLKSEIVEGKLAVPESELTEFPFNQADKYRIDMQPALDKLRARVEFLEKSVRAYCSRSVADRGDCSRMHRAFSDKDDLCPICGKPLNPNF